MHSGDPLLYHIRESFGFSGQSVVLRIASNKSVVIVNHVPLPLASVEIVAIRVSSLANREFKDFNANPVVPRHGHTVTGACDRHFCSLQGGIVCSRKTPVCRYPIQRCIGEVASNDGSELVQFFL